MIDQIRDAIEFIKTKTTIVPKVAMQLGSGAYSFLDKIDEKVEIDFSLIPHFPTRQNCANGRLIIGKLNGVAVAILTKRQHLYQGYTEREIAFPIRLMRLLGAEILFAMNASGAINPEYSVGDIVTVSDHINTFGLSPTRGEGKSDFGDEFFDMCNAYDKDLRALVHDIDSKINDGVYIVFAGPQFETPAEINMARIMGADLVGMSTVTETIVANQCGLRVLCLALVTNMAAGVVAGSPITAEEVSETAEKSEKEFNQLIEQIIDRLGEL